MTAQFCDIGTCVRKVAACEEWDLTTSSDILASNA